MPVNSSSGVLSTKSGLCGNKTSLPSTVTPIVPTADLATILKRSKILAWNGNPSISRSMQILILPTESETVRPKYYPLSSLLASPTTTSPLAASAARHGPQERRWRVRRRAGPRRRSARRDRWRGRKRRTRVPFLRPVPDRERSPGKGIGDKSPGQSSGMTTSASDRSIPRSAHAGPIAAKFCAGGLRQSAGIG